MNPATNDTRRRRASTRLSLQLALGLIAACSWLPAAIAATVAPTDRVTSYVVVRRGPSSESQAVGRLQPGDVAETVDGGDIPRWLKVKLADGTVGYVTKAWVEEVQAPSTVVAVVPTSGPPTGTVPSGAPTPLLDKGHAVDWWFVFKFNTKSFPECSDGTPRECPFGGTAQEYHSGFGQQFVYASSEAPTLQKGSGCVGQTTTDPVGATFDQVYNNAFHYLIWNDQFYDDPAIAGCTKACRSPWGHSKGMLAWNDAGEGFVLQVSTPSWPAAGSAVVPRKTDGNTLG
jgi:hypothetical protein